MQFSTQQIAPVAHLFVEISVALLHHFLELLLLLIVHDERVVELDRKSSLAHEGLHRTHEPQYVTSFVDGVLNRARTEEYVEYLEWSRIHHGHHAALNHLLQRDDARGIIVQLFGQLAGLAHDQLERVLDRRQDDRLLADHLHAILQVGQNSARGEYGLLLLLQREVVCLRLARVSEASLEQELVCAAKSNRLVTRPHSSKAGRGTY